MKALLWFQAFRLTTGLLLSAGLSYGGFNLLTSGSIAKGGHLDLKAAFLSGTVTADSAGLAMIFAAVVVFVATLAVRTQISRSRMTVGSCTDSGSSDMGVQMYFAPESCRGVSR